MSTISNIVREFDATQFIPPELKGAVYKKQDIVPDDAIDIQVETLGDDESDLDEDVTAASLETPDVFSIISQTVRIGSDGRQVIDVVFEVEDVSGASGYEIRVSKV